MFTARSPGGHLDGPKCTPRGMTRGEPLCREGVDPTGPRPGGVESGVCRRCYPGPPYRSGAI